MWLELRQTMIWTSFSRSNKNKLYVTEYKSPWIYKDAQEKEIKDKTRHNLKATYLSSVEVNNFSENCIL